MQLLASSPKIAFDRHYPYEVRHLSYLTRAAHVIANPLERQRDDLPFRWGQASLLKRGLRYVGPLPVRSDLLDPERRFHSTLRALYASFSEELRYSVPNSTHYAEKMTSTDIINHVSQIAPAKTVYGVRDPRDQMVSIMKFNEKRGTFRFGWRTEDDQLSFAKRFCDRSRGYLKQVCQLPGSQGTAHIVVRYEDLVSNLESSTKRISNWLGVTLDASVVVEKRDLMNSRHATSATVDESVGRWNLALEPAVKALFEHELGEFLELMGW